MKVRIALALAATAIPAIVAAQTAAPAATAGTPAPAVHATTHAVVKSTYTPKISADSAKAIALATEKDDKVVWSHLVYAYKTHYYKIKLSEKGKSEYVRVNAEDGSLFTIPAPVKTPVTHAKTTPAATDTSKKQ